MAILLCVAFTSVVQAQSDIVTYQGVVKSGWSNSTATANPPSGGHLTGYMMTSFGNG